MSTETQHQRGYKYRLYPTPAQEVLLCEWQETLRHLWNALLGPYADAIRETITPMKTVEVCIEEAKAAGVEPKGLKAAMSEARKKEGLRVKLEIRALFKARKWTLGVMREKDRERLRELRKSNPFLAKMAYAIADAMVLSIGKAWQSYFAGLTKRPTFKDSTEHPSILGASEGVFRVEGDCVSFSMLELNEKRVLLRFEKHREVPSRPTRAVVTRTGRRWYVVLGVTVPSIVQDAPREAVGIDRGVVAMLADSDGRMVPGFKSMDALEKRKHFVESRVAKKKKGSKNRRKWVVKLASIQRRVADTRADVLHKEALYYATNYKVVVIEDLNVAGMTRSAKGTAVLPGSNVAQKAGLNRAILRQGWGMFQSFLGYKLAQRGGTLVTVPAQYSSQTCSQCGHVAAESRLEQSKFCCVACGFTDHADHNAARVVLARGLKQLASPAEIPAKPKKRLYTVTGRTRTPKSSATGAQVSETLGSSDAAAGSAVKLPVEDGNIGSPDEAGRTVPSICSPHPDSASLRSRASTPSVPVFLTPCVGEIHETPGIPRGNKEDTPGSAWSGSK